MKKMLFLIMTSFAINAFGQVQSFTDIPQSLLEKYEEMGMSDSLLLNEYESQYLNFIFEKSRKDFDFTGKKIAFITGSSGRKIVTKANYFKLEKDRYISNYTPNFGGLYIFNETQKEKSGGYDAVIFYWCKVIMPINKAVELLRRK